MPANTERIAVAVALLAITAALTVGAVQLLFHLEALR
jgi:hypothetical protein